MIYCDVYRCRMMAEACAARHLNAVKGGHSPVGRARAGFDDPNCRVCKEGMARVNGIGKARIDAFRQELKEVKAEARDRIFNAGRTEGGEVTEDTMPADCAIDNTGDKVCKKCGETKKMDEFYNVPNAKDGKDGACKKCRNKLNTERKRAKRLSAKEKKNSEPTRADGMGVMDEVKQMDQAVEADDAGTGGQVGYAGTVSIVITIEKMPVKQFFETISKVLAA